MVGGDAGESRLQMLQIHELRARVQPVSLHVYTLIAAAVTHLKPLFALMGKNIKHLG